MRDKYVARDGGYNDGVVWVGKESDKLDGTFDCRAKVASFGGPNYSENKSRAEEYAEWMNSKLPHYVVTSLGSAAGLIWHVYETLSGDKIAEFYYGDLGKRRAEAYAERLNNEPDL